MAFQSRVRVDNLTLWLRSYAMPNLIQFSLEVRMSHTPHHLSKCVTTGDRW